MTHRAPARPSPTRRLLSLGAAACLALVAACGGGPAEAPEPSSVEREAFIATYVDLRAAAIREGVGNPADAERQRILQEHGVTEQDLLDFAEAHGEDVAYMRQVWDEVERRLDEIRLTSDPDARR